jgi:hypothetical protein
MALYEQIKTAMLTVTSRMLRRSIAALCAPGWPGTKATGMLGKPKPIDDASASFKKP